MFFPAHVALHVFQENTLNTLSMHCVDLLTFSTTNIYKTTAHLSLLLLDVLVRTCLLKQTLPGNSPLWHHKGRWCDWVVPLAESKQQPQPSAYSNCRDHLIISLVWSSSRPKKKRTKHCFWFHNVLFGERPAVHPTSLLTLGWLSTLFLHWDRSADVLQLKTAVLSVLRPNHLNNLIPKGGDALETKRATLHFESFLLRLQRKLTSDGFCMCVKLFCGSCVAFPHSVQETVAYRLQRLRHEIKPQ